MKKSPGNRDNGGDRTDIFAYAASRAFVSDSRIDPSLQDNGSSFKGTIFKAAPADNRIAPRVAGFPVQPRFAYSHIINRDLFKGAGGAHRAAAHAKIAGNLPGKYLWCAGNKQVKSGLQLDRPVWAYLSALAALDAASQKLFFGSGARRP
jgi:hypothetical protein